ncbi:MAG: DUF1778 domain-containing protein [Alphaproteobacteria bacterium]
MSALELRHLRTEEKVERIGVRTTGVVKATLVHAAALSGQSLSDFILQSALNVAKETVSAHERLELTSADRETFIEALFNPSEPSERLKAAARRYKDAVR